MVAYTGVKFPVVPIRLSFMEDRRPWVPIPGGPTYRCRIPAHNSLIIMVDVMKRARFGAIG